MDPSEVRLKEHLGIVTSDTSTTSFSFFVTPLRNKTWVGKEDFILIEHPFLGESCPLIAVVREIKNYEEIVGSTVNEKSVQTTANAEILGFIDLRNDEKRALKKSSVAPGPGSKIYLPYAEFLEDIFLRDLEGKLFEHPLHVGSLESHAPSRDGSARQLSFSLDAKDFAKHHFLIAAISGAGKTHTATVIVEELATEAGWPVVFLASSGSVSRVRFKLCE
jgi:DNA helicase HerA-like ATPase